MTSLLVGHICVTGTHVRIRSVSGGGGRLLRRCAVRALLPRFPGVQRAYLFGSVLHPGGWRATSDVDIAIEGKLDAREYLALWRELERAAPDWLIDLVELGQDLRFAERVRERGELIYGDSDSDVESGH